MKVNALNQTLSNIMSNQNESCLRHTGGHQSLIAHKIDCRRIQHPALLKRSAAGGARPQVCVEKIGMSADRRFMYCKGNVRSRRSARKSCLVVAVEWLDGGQKTLNTDWKRIDLNGDGQTVPLSPAGLRPFIVKAPLDRRVKCVTAYAFSGYQSKQIN